MKTAFSASSVSHSGESEESIGSLQFVNGQAEGQRLEETQNLQLASEMGAFL